QALAELRFDEPEDEQRDPDDRDQGMDALVFVQEDWPHPQGLLEVAVAALDDLLALVAVKDRVGAQAPVGEVGGERVDAVGSGGLGDLLLAALPADRRAALAGCRVDLDEVLDGADQDLGDAAVELLAGLVVAPAEAASHPLELVLGSPERALACRFDLAFLLGGVDVGQPEAVAFAGLGVFELPIADRASVAGALGCLELAFALRDVAERPQRRRSDLFQVA